MIYSCVDTKTGYYSLAVNIDTLPNYDRQCANPIEALGYTAPNGDTNASPLYHLYYNNGKGMVNLYTVNASEKYYDMAHDFTLDAGFDLAVNVYNTPAATTAAVNLVYLQTSTDTKFPDDRRYVADYTRGSDAAYGGAASWMTFTANGSVAFPYFYAAKNPS